MEQNTLQGNNPPGSKQKLHDYLQNHGQAICLQQKYWRNGKKTFSRKEELY